MKSKQGILMMKWCFLAFCILTILSTASISWAASISGTIYDTSPNPSPLPFVSAQLLTPERQWLGFGSCSDQHGFFTIPDIPAGNYILLAGGWPCGPATAYAQTFYSEDGNGNFIGTYDPNQALVLTIGTSDVEGKNFYLVPGATISGMVTGSGGTPLEKVNVGVSPVGIDNWGYGGCTDSSGNYSVQGLPPGTYRVSAAGQNWCGGLNYVQAFYNNKPDWNSADLITLNSGQTLSNVNFSGLVLGATISGMVTDAGGAPLENVQVNVHGSNWGSGSCTDNTGSYTIGGIPPGTYRISAGGQNWCENGELYKQVFYNNKPEWNSADLITLSVGGARNDINFSNLTLEAAISGMITGDPNIGIRNINVVLHDNSGRLVNFQRLGGGGGFYFGGLTPGETYTIKVYDPFLRYEYAEEGGLVASSGGLITANFTLTNYVPIGTNPPIFKSNPMAFVIHTPDGSEILQVSAEVEDPSGCQPASLKSVTAIGPDGTFHYLYHEKYQALVEHVPPMTYGEFWWTSRDNEFVDMSTNVGDFTITALDVEGNRATATARLDSYTQYKLPIPTLINPAPGTQVNANSLTLSWDPVANAMAYQVRIMYLGERIWKCETAPGTSCSVPPNVLLEGRWYSWNIMAFDNTSRDQIDYASVSETRNFFTIGGETPPSEALSVQVALWIPASPLIPHDTYAGRQTTLKAVAKGGSPPYTYTWDFGDGSPPVTTTTSNRYNLEAVHSYPSGSDTFYDAKITVTDSSGTTASAIYPVRFWANPSRGVKVNVAIDDALWWLHKNMSRFTSDGIDYGQLNPQYYPTGSTALALQAWVLNGHRPDGDPNNPYVEDAIRAKNYILDHLYPICIGPETVAGVTRTPDSNGNGIGLYVKNGNRMYESGLVLMALATLKDASLTNTIQDLIDYLAYAQVEPDVGGGRGGWRYDANYRESDMSVTQFPLIGLEAAEYHLGSSVTIPSYVKEELKNNFLHFVQNKESGGFGYSWPNSLVNVAKTGAGIAGLALTGILYDDPRTTQALSYIDQEWLTAISWPNIAGMRYNIGDLYAMYAVMKGIKSYEMKGYNTPMIGSHDWYNEYALWEIQNQNSNGSWQSPVNSYGPFIDTSLGVLILLPQIFAIGPTAVAQASPTAVQTGEPVTFNHSGSFHIDSTKTIVLYQWDFNGDGVFEWSTSNRIETHQYIFGSAGSYTATLRVTDNGGLIDMDQVAINVSPRPFLPVTIEIKPETLNLSDKGVFTAFITLPDGCGYGLSDIDTTTLVCEGARVKSTNIAAKKLIAKFNTQDLVGVPTGDNVTLTVKGKFKDGTLLEGWDTIRVINKKK